jgi:hypothetical protein
MTNSASRKQARRFWGAMGAAMRQTSRLLDARNQPRAETVIRRMNGLREIQFETRNWRGA